jgi:hypothetical protein
MMNVPIIYQSRCHTCSHPERAWIERMMIRGMSFVWIARTLNRMDGENIRTRSLSRHYTNHLEPVLARIERQLVHDAEFEAMLNRVRPENETHDGPDFCAWNLRPESDFSGED